VDRKSFQQLTPCCQNLRSVACLTCGSNTNDSSSIFYLFWVVLTIDKFINLPSIDVQWGKMPAFALHIDSCKKLFDRFKLRKESLRFALVAIGSVVTDLEEFGILKGVHGRAEEFLKYLLKTDPKYAPLAIGMIMHEELDNVIDKHFVNPKMAEAQELLEKYNLHSEKVSLAAHYLIDHSVNCSMLEEEPHIIIIAEKAKKRLSNRHAHKIAYHLTKFFSGNHAEVLNALHTFKDFNLSQYLSSEDSAALYGKFLFLQEELKERKPVGLMDKIKLGLSYGSFMFKNRKHVVKEMCTHARQKFSNHRKSYVLACKAMAKRFAKISDTYPLMLRKDL